MNQQQYKMSQQPQQVPLAHNGQNNHNQRRSSKVPVRELPEAMPKYQHPVYPQLYCVQEPHTTCYKWDCIILDLDRTIIHGKRLSVKRWRKYVENGTIPSLAENQCSKWHRHIHRKGHQMHPFIRGRTMIYYRPFTWHLLAVLDYLKSHFGTKIIICTKAGEHYAASVLAALISNFTSANPDLIDDVYNFHDLHDDENDNEKPKKPFRLICNRHDLDPKKTLIVDDNATSWFDPDRKITNFWMPPCYGYQIHDIDNELQLLCKYLWDPIQQNHLKKKQIQIKNEEKPIKRYQDNDQMHHTQHHSRCSNTTDSTISPNLSPKRPEIVSRVSPKSVSSKSHSLTTSPKKPQYYLNSPLSHETAELDEHKMNGGNGSVTSISRIGHSYNKRKYHNGAGPMGMIEVNLGNHKSQTQSKPKPKSPPTKTKKKYGFFESKSRGSKKLAKIIGK
eukprot:212030_1